MSNIYFENVVKIGKLYLEYIFYEFENEPILFSCHDDEKRIYICLCSDIRYGQKWLVAECNIVTLKSLIMEEIDIASAFLASKKVTAIHMDLQGNESSTEIDRDNIDRLDLPKERTFIRCDKEAACNYLWRKELELLSVQSSNAAMSTAFIIPEIIKSYSVAFSTSINLLNERVKLYLDSMIIRSEYSICKTERYVKQIDDLDINCSDGSNYPQAA